MSVFVPRWTVGGPFDDFSSMPALDRRQHRDMARVQNALVRGLRPAHEWFPAIRRLHNAYPAWAWANFRFAYAALYLEDLKTAVQYFERARDLVTGTDDVFDAWFASFKSHVEKESSIEDALWPNPEDGTVVQSFRPPMDLDAFQYDDPQNVIDLMNEWEALQEHLTPDVAAQRYTRLLAVQSSELEEVFSLGAESLPRIVRAGFYSGAIDRVRHGPPGGVRAIAEILRDFNRGLEYLNGTVFPSGTITQESVLTIHGELMKSSQIGYTHFDGDEVAYLNTVGAYRHRLVTAELPSAEDEPTKIVQFARHQEIEQHMEDFLAMANRRIANASLGRGDPAAFSLAAWIHYNLAVIHPFTDGNGRVVRIVSSLPLLKAGFPPINIRHAVKEEYLAALHIAATAADLRPLAQLLASEMQEAVKYLRGIPPPSPQDSQWRFNVDDGKTRIAL